MSDPSKVIIVLSFFASVSYTVRFIMMRAYPSGPKQDMLTSGLAVSDDRMARLEQAVESIAIEVERISEGQRFTTKLLAERAAAAPARPAMPANLQQ